MSRNRIIKTLAVAGYLLLAVAGVPQWWHLLTTRDATGLSLPFLTFYFVGLAALQVSFWLARLGRALIWGNLAGLVNAALCLGLYLRLTAGR